MRRVAAIGCGLVVAIAVAVLALPTFAFAATLMQGRLAGLPQSVLDIVIWFAWADSAGTVLHQAIAAALESVAVICIGPVVIAALVGEAAGLRTSLWYTIATAILSIALPFASGQASLAVFARPVAAGPLAATGAIAGLVYWLIAVPSDRPVRAADPFNLAPPASSAKTRHEP